MKPASHSLQLTLALLGGLAIQASVAAQVVQIRFADDVPDAILCPAASRAIHFAQDCPEPAPSASDVELPSAMDDQQMLTDSASGDNTIDSGLSGASGKGICLHISDHDCPACCCCSPCWTFYADALYFDRSSQTGALITGSALGHNEGPVPDFGYQIGYRIGGIRHRDCKSDLEFAYLGFDEWSENQSVRGATVDLFTLNNVYQTGFQPGVDNFDIAHTAALHSFELNLRCCRSPRVTFLHGPRYIDLDESLQLGVDFDGVGGNEINFLTSVTNDLYGYQVGFDADLYCNCRWNWSLLGKLGGYYNRHQETSTLNTPATIFTDDDGNYSLVAEGGLFAAYHIRQCLSLRAGYQAMWLSDVATAADQVRSTNLQAGTGDVSTDSVILYGGFVGVELVR